MASNENQDGLQEEEAHKRASALNEGGQEGDLGKNEAEVIEMDSAMGSDAPEDDASKDSTHMQGSSGEGRQADKSETEPIKVDPETSDAPSNDQPSSEKEDLSPDPGKDTGEIEFVDPSGEEGGGEAEKPATLEAALVPEKLADDVMKPPLWQRVLYHVFPRLERSERTLYCGLMWKRIFFFFFAVEFRRELKANDAVYNHQFKYAVSWSAAKYSLF